MSPKSADDLTREGITLHRRGDLAGARAHYDAALALYDRALAFQENAEILLRRASVKRELGRLHEALADCERAVALRPDFADALIGLGRIRLLLGRARDALPPLEHALVLEPGSVDGLMLRGAALACLGRASDALACIDGALARDPARSEAHWERGNVLCALGRLEEAVAAYELAVPVDAPSEAALRYNCGAARLALQHPAQALVDFDAALAIRSDYPEAMFGRAQALAALKRNAEAVDAYTASLKRDPQLRYGLGHLWYHKALLCDWSDHDEITRAIVEGVQARRPVTVPLPFVAISDEPDQLRACAQAYVQAAGLPRTTYRKPAQPRRDKIRLAYLSANFNEHAVAYLIAELLERHDRKRFEVCGVSFGTDDGGPMVARIRRACDRYVDVRQSSDSAVAEALRELGVDIAVDLMGHTNEARMGILARRPAPIQVNYLGYPGTMGAEFADYIIADSFIIPPGDERFYSEQVVRLPDSYQPNDTHRRIAAATPARRDLGLPERSFVFCSFNNSFKLNPAMFDVWMQLLRQVDGAVLWLLETNRQVRDNLRAEAVRRDVDPTRLVFAPRAALDFHLARHRAADLFLDSLPYNAHTTGSDALWAGLPLLTCAGRSFASRVAGSLLHAVGLPELVAHSLAEYEARAVELARDPQLLLRSLRERLERNLHVAALFDIERLRRHIETAYTTMWEIYLRGDPPRHFDVPAISV